MISGIRFRTFRLASACVGSTAVYTGRPSSVVERAVSHSPTATVTTWLAIGSAVCQVNVVRPPRVRSSRNSPLETTPRPSGTVIARSYVALSEGWWLPGNQAIEPVGSPSPTAPSAVGSQPSSESSGSVMVSGSPEYRTVTRNVSPSFSSSAGRTVSSCPARLNRASRPSTVTSSTSRPLRSRSKADRSRVARAVIVAVPVRCPAPEPASASGA